MQGVYYRAVPVFAIWILLAVVGQAQEEEPADKGVKEKASEVVEETRSAAEEVAETVNKSEKAQEATTGILKPIYRLAEYLAFPAFHWLAFMVMVTGVVSFALQLVLAKLLVLSKRGFSVTEILSDALGLAISLIGLVLTTQAAAQNSTFTTSPAAVLSASAVGIVAGFIFYWWGQSLELQAVEGRRHKKS